MTLQVKIVKGYYCETLKFHTQLYLLSDFFNFRFEFNQRNA